jgi:tetratricopeptide (TPR) repeat protein
MRIRLTAVALLIVFFAGCSRSDGTDDPPPGWVDAEKGLVGLSAEGKTGEVVRICESFVRDYPDFPDAHLTLAYALEQMGKDLRRAGSAGSLATQTLERAATHFERFHALVSGDKRFLATSALMFLHDERGLNDPIKAEAFARRWTEERPDFFDAYVAHADYLRKLNRHDEATAVIRKARGVSAAGLTGDEQMRAGLRAAWAATVAEHLQESPNLPLSDTREFADEVIAVSNDVLKVNPNIMMAIEAKAKALAVVAQRLESDPRRKTALMSEVEALERRMRQ